MVDVLTLVCLAAGWWIICKFSQKGEKGQLIQNPPLPTHPTENFPYTYKFQFVRQHVATDKVNSCKCKCNFSCCIEDGWEKKGWAPASRKAGCLTGTAQAVKTWWGKQKKHEMGPKRPNTQNGISNSNTGWTKETQTGEVKQECARPCVQDWCGDMPACFTGS